MQTRSDKDNRTHMGRVKSLKGQRISSLSGLNAPAGTLSLQLGHSSEYAVFFGTQLRGIALFCNLPFLQYNDFIRCFNRAYAMCNNKEYVRQTIENRLINEHKYLPSQIKIEYPLQVGSKKPRADIVIWNKDADQRYRELKQ